MIKKNKGSRSWSRILAVQALYQLSLNKDAKESKVIKDLIQNEESKNRADKIFLSKLVKETIKKKKQFATGGIFGGSHERIAVLVRTPALRNAICVLGIKLS